MLSSLQQQVNDIKVVGLRTNDPTQERMINLIVNLYDKSVELEDRIRLLENESSQQVIKVKLNNGANSQN